MRTMKNKRIEKTTTVCDSWVVVLRGLTWARSFCFSASREPRWADSAIMTWRRTTEALGPLSQHSHYCQ